jgi:ketosteroid isomerase-like protein
MNEESVKAVVEAFYRSRLANDVERCVAHFVADGAVRIAGLPRHSLGDGGGAESLRQIYVDLIAAWEWRRMQIESMTIQHGRAVVHYRLDVVFRPTGEAFQTELLDVFTVRESKISSIVEFLDTARVEQVVAKVQAG